MANHYTKVGLVERIYITQIRSSRARGHMMPEYELDELMVWVLTQPLFHRLFRSWEKSRHDKMFIPSIDRINPDKHYYFENIQIMTWEENAQKGYIENAERAKKARRNSTHKKSEYTNQNYTIKLKFVDMEELKNITLGVLISTSIGRNILGRDKVLQKIRDTGFAINTGKLSEIYRILVIEKKIIQDRMDRGYSVITDD